MCIELRHNVLPCAKPEQPEYQALAAGDAVHLMSNVCGIRVHNY